MFPGDGRGPAREFALTLEDPRATQMWDGDRAVGAWFHENVVARLDHMKDRPVFGRGFVWDTYLAFPADVGWDEGRLFERVVASGAPIVRDPDPLLEYAKTLEVAEAPGGDGK